MNLIKFPYYAETLDGMARVKFTNFYDFEILTGTIAKKEELYEYRVQCSDSRFWRKCPDDIRKSFRFEVIDGTAIVNQLFTDVEIIEYAKRNRHLIKTGRVFVL